MAFVVLFPDWQYLIACINCTGCLHVHKDIVSAIPAPSLLGKATLSFDNFKLLGTPRHSLTFETCSVPCFSYLSKAFDLYCTMTHLIVSHL
jgi:hypothetical protein